MQNSLFFCILSFIYVFCLFFEPPRRFIAIFSKSKLCIFFPFLKCQFIIYFIFITCLLMNLASGFIHLLIIYSYFLFHYFQCLYFYHFLIRRAPTISLPNPLVNFHLIVLWKHPLCQTGFFYSIIR